jgi:hypothetical protein
MSATSKGPRRSYLRRPLRGLSLHPLPSPDSCQDVGTVDGEQLYNNAYEIVAVRNVPVE